MRIDRQTYLRIYYVVDVRRGEKMSAYGRQYVFGPLKIKKIFDGHD